METAMICACLLVIGVAAGAVWVSTWETRERRSRREEPKQMTQQEKSRLFETILQEMAKSEEDET